MSNKNCTGYFAATLFCAATGFVAVAGSTSACERPGLHAADPARVPRVLAVEASFDDAWIVRYGKYPDYSDHPWAERRFNGPDAEQNARDFCIGLEMRGYTKFDYTIDRAPIAAISG